MARKKVLPEGTSTESALSADDGVTIPRLSLQEQGFIGLRTRNGQILGETNRAFQYPNFIKTVNEIRHNPTVGSAMSVYRMMISRVNWRVEACKGASPIDIERARLVGTMMDDMQGSWRSFIEEVVPYLEYGYGIHEKVFRRRLTRNKSKYSDGIIGIAKLAPRNQDTIEKWNYSADGADLLGVSQNISNVEDSFRFFQRTDVNGLIKIDREKFLLFTASGNRGNYQGNSIYKAIYLAFKTLQLIQDNELLGVAKDTQGILKIAIPPRYLDSNGSPEDRAVALSFQNIIDNYNAGTQRGLLVPNIYDPESKQALFTYELMESKGTSKYDVESIIKRIQGDILSALSVDILKLGADGTGSFSLAESKSSILAIAIDYRLREIAEVLNSDLMVSIFSANGWSQENLPKFVYEDIEEVSITDFSSAVQRIFATSAIEMDRPIMNRIRGVLGVPELPDDMPLQEDKLPANITGQASKSGEGMKTGNEGTRKNAISGSGDSSIANKENTP